MRLQVSYLAYTQTGSAKTLYAANYNTPRVTAVDVTNPAAPAYSSHVSGSYLGGGPTEPHTHDQHAITLIH